MSSIEKISEQKSFGGVQGFYRHMSAVCNGPMRVSVYQPPHARQGVVPVVYHGESPPPLFAVGRNVVVSGSYTAGRLGANAILTKCPSKYTAKPSQK